MSARRRRPALFPPVLIYKECAPREARADRDAHAAPFPPLYSPCLYGEEQQLLDTLPRRWRDLFNYSFLGFPPQAVVKLPQLLARHGREHTFAELSALLGVDKSSLPK